MARAALDVAIGHALVQGVEPPREDVAAAKPGGRQIHQGAGVQGLQDQAVLEVLAQKLVFKIGQAVGPKRRVVGSHNAATRHPADHVRRLQQVGGFALPGVFDLAQLGQHAKAKCRRTGPAARQRDRHQNRRVAPLDQQAFGGFAVWVQRRIGPGLDGGAASHCCQQQQRAPQAQGAFHGVVAVNADTLYAASNAGRSAMLVNTCVAPAARRA